MNNRKQLQILNAKSKLNENNLSFECKNNDFHFIIEGDINFWPTSKGEIWIINSTNERGYGLQKLIDKIVGN